LGTLYFKSALLWFLLPKTKQKCYVCFVNSNEFKRWLEKQGATFKPGKGGPPQGVRKWQKVGVTDAWQAGIEPALG